jgi:hypothetical protein
MTASCFTSTLPRLSKRCTAPLMNNFPFFFTEKPTLDQLRLLFQQTLFLRLLANTAFVGVLVVAITLLLSLPAAYGLARLTGRWGQRLGITIFLTYLVPPTLLFIPLSRVIAILGLQDSPWSLVLVYPSFTIPFSTWLFTCRLFCVISSAFAPQMPVSGLLDSSCSRHFAGLSWDGYPTRLAGLECFRGFCQPSPLSVCCLVSQPCFRSPLEPWVAQHCSALVTARYFSLCRVIFLPRERPLSAWWVRWAAWEGSFRPYYWACSVTA